MPNTKDNQASIKAVQRYRRVKTIVNKAVETADICGLHLNILVYDPHFHRFKEHYTSTDVKLESLHKLAQDMPNTTKSKQKVRQLKFQSINARHKN